MIPPTTLARSRIPSVAVGLAAFAVVFMLSTSLDLTRDEDRGAARASGFAPNTLSASDIHDLVAQRGYRNIGQVERRGAIFIVEATGPDGVHKTLVATARDGMLVGDGPIDDAQPASQRVRSASEE